MKKLVSLFLALVMALSLSTIAMADGNGKPVAAKTTSKPSEIQLVTIGGTNAVYQVDGYGNPNSPTYDDSQLFIRATLPATTTEESLKSQTVIITMEDETTITGGTLLSAGTGYTYDDVDYIYTINGVDLLNKSYTIVLDGHDNENPYILAAGINDNNQAQVAIPSTDPLAISNVVFNGATTAANVYRVTVQNPCMATPTSRATPIRLRMAGLSATITSLQLMSLPLPIRRRYLPLLPRMPLRLWAAM